MIVLNKRKISRAAGEGMRKIIMARSNAEFKQTPCVHVEKLCGGIAYGIGSMEELPEYLAFAKPFLRAGSNTADEMIRSQVLQTLLKRLAGLQSTYFLRRGNMECVVEYFDRLRQSFLQKKADGVYQRFNTVPTSIQVEQNMVKLVKWTSSYGDDENGCYLIEESFQVPEEGKEND